VNSQTLLLNELVLLRRVALSGSNWPGEVYSCKWLLRRCGVRVLIAGRTDARL